MPKLAQTCPNLPKLAQTCPNLCPNLCKPVFFSLFQHAPGIPKVLVGNRLHLAFKRQVDQAEAETYAERNAMGFFEVSPLVNFNISETFVELARKAIMRNGLERLWRSNKGNLLV